MVNDDILLQQKNARVCTSASDRNWTGHAVSPSGQSQEIRRSSWKLLCENDPIWHAPLLPACELQHGNGTVS